MSANCSLVFLPGLDGSGLLFQPLLDCLPPATVSRIVTYPPDQLLGYEQLLSLVLAALPMDQPFILVGESFSGPLALMAAAEKPAGLRGVVLSASFVRAPLFRRLRWLTPIIRGIFFQLVPTAAQIALRLGRFATPRLRQLLGAAIESTRPRVLAHRVRCVMRVDVRAQLALCQVPVLYLQAIQDQTVPARNLKEMLKILPTMRVERFQSNHYLLQVQPRQAAAAIMEFAGKLR